MDDAASSTLCALDHPAEHCPLPGGPGPPSGWRPLIAGMVLMLLSGFALAESVAQDDRAFTEQSSGAQLIPFTYLGRSGEPTPSAGRPWQPTPF
jgi:hypothetical protein